ncbi:MAG TPA: hypothetical protein VMG60_06010 [Burkholderiaceae bacterium]|nr:hypothetical protein [Burkholderiaceae bacterium]
MPRTTRRPLLMAVFISAPVALLALGGRLAGFEAIAHTGALLALTLGLPWVVPGFVVVAVLSAPLYVALHIAGLPQPLAPWLSWAVLLGAVAACHVNAALLMSSLRKRARALDRGLAGFLFRSPARIV